MFEFDKYDPNKAGSRTKPAQPYRPFDGGKERAFLLWGEHCIECAAPACFTTCDLYEARPDERCRRFEYGIYRNTSYPSARGFGAEVVFKRWGKIEARGNAVMLPAWLCGGMERGLPIVLPLLNRFGRAVRRAGAAIRWSYVTFGALERFNRWLDKRASPRARPDAFMAEIYNPSETAIALVLAIGVDRSQIAGNVTADQLPRPFSKRLSIAPGYNRFDVPASEFATVLESGLPFNLALIPDAEDGSNLVFLSLDLLTYKAEGLAAAATETSVERKEKPKPAAKCVVFDLDNTLWDGVLLEGEVTLRPGVKALFAELDKRGILISVASKNSHDDAMAKLKAFGLDEYLLFPQINWTQKSQSLHAIADKISINLDTFVFVDDNPFEREEVARFYPQVETLPDTALGRLLENPRLKGSTTAEAGRRRAMYQEAIEREDAAVTFGDDYLAFLKSCEIVVDIMPVTDQHMERVIELVQRTNQLNFSGRKYGREEIQAILGDDVHGKHVLACADKYGSYGVVGFAITRPIEGGIRVEDFMLSCRVQGKFVEQALFDYLVRTSEPPARVLEVNFVKTDRNALAEAVLQKLGFAVEEGGKGQPLRRSVTAQELAVDFLTVRDHSTPQGDAGRDAA